MQCCVTVAVHKWVVTRHTQSKHEIGSIVQQNVIHPPSNIQNQHNSQYGTGENTHIPIEKHNEALDLIHKLKALWRNSKKEKIAYEKLQEEHRLVQEYRREDGEHTLATISYLENVLNANNIRYNLDLA